MAKPVEFQFIFWTQILAILNGEQIELLKIDEIFYFFSFWGHSQMT